MDEELLVLRLPPRIADVVRTKLRNKEDISDMILHFLDTKHALGLGRQTMAYGRMADLWVGPQQFQARLLDLPCVVEALKTRNNQDYVKVGNVGQMLCVTEIEQAHLLPEPSQPEAFIAHSGLTRAAHNALHRLKGDRKEITEEDKANMKRVLEEVERVWNKSLGKDSKKGDGDGAQKEKEDKDRDETYEELELDDDEIAAMQKDLQVGKDIPLDLDGKSPRKRKHSTKLTVGGGKKRRQEGGAAAAGAGAAVAVGEPGLPAGSPPLGAYDMTSDQLMRAGSSGTLSTMGSAASPNLSPGSRFVLSPPLTTAASPGYSSDGGPSPAYSPGYSSDGGGVYSDDGGAVNSDEDGAVLSEEEGGGQLPQGSDEEPAAAAAAPAQSLQQEEEEEDDDLAGFMDDLEEALDGGEEEAAGGEEAVEGGPLEGMAPTDDGGAGGAGGGGGDGGGGGAVGSALDDPRLFEIAEKLGELEQSLAAQRNLAMRNRLQDQIDKLRAEEASITGSWDSGGGAGGVQGGEEVVEGGAVVGGAVEGSALAADAGAPAAAEEEDTLEQELLDEFGGGGGGIDGSFGLDEFDTSGGW
jgi:hypothetical protein